MFHLNSGIHFERCEDGSVRIVRQLLVDDPVEVLAVAEPMAWASVVASVSRAGETHATWRAALTMHGE